MADTTKIEWTDFTVNFWEGCQKVGPGCDHCYAEARDKRFTGGAHWGPGAPRRKVKGGIAKLRKIQDGAMKFHNETGRWPRVFCSSLSDMFDNAVDPAWRVEAFTEIDRAANPRVQLLTKRIGNVEKMIPDMWRHFGWPAHVGLMITVVNQPEADRDIPKLLDLKVRFGIPWVGLSMEPLLGPVDLARWMATAKVTCKACGHSFWLHEADPCKHQKWGEWTLACPECSDCRCEPGSGKSPFPKAPNDWVAKNAGRFDRVHPTIPVTPALDWVITGGESGPGARPMHPDWARSLRDQCTAAGVAFFFKQWGEWVPLRASAGSWPVDGKQARRLNHDGTTGPGGVPIQRVGKARAGRLLDGREWNEVPG